MKSLFTYLAVMCSLTLFSQSTWCDNRLDSARVIKIAKRHNSYWTGEWFAQPYKTFNEQNCEWTITSSRYRHTNKGRCKYTNGCTLVTRVTLVIDATTAKVKSREKEKKLFPNYE